MGPDQNITEIISANKKLTEPWNVVKLDRNRISKISLVFHSKFNSLQPKM